MCVVFRSLSLLVVVLLAVSVTPAADAPKPVDRTVLARLAKGINTDFAPLGDPVQKVSYDPAYLDAANRITLDRVSLTSIRTDPRATPNATSP